MKENQVMVESCADCTVVIDIPEDRFRKEWTKRGQKYPVDREYLTQIMYRPGVEYLFKNGYLKCMDKEFMEEADLLNEDGSPKVVELTEALMKRIIGVMPMKEYKEQLQKLTRSQIVELADYAIANPSELKIDKVDLLNKLAQKDILKAIEFAKADQEG